MKAQIQSFFDPATWTITHVIHAGKGSACAIVDSVLDYDPKAGRTSHQSADRVIAFVKEWDLKTEWILETHAHADHLSAAPYLKQHLGGKIAIGAKIKLVQAVFKNIFNLEPAFRLDGSQFDHLFSDGEIFHIGALQAQVLYVPGHTPACSAYVLENGGQTDILVGDTLFPPDVGTARCDFPGGDAHQLFQSIRKVLAYPPETKLYFCHDYPPDKSRPPMVLSTVAAERADNIHVHDGITEAEFVQMRSERDKTLAMPNLILPAVQINIRAGELPPPEDNGTRYVKIPLNAL